VRLVAIPVPALLAGIGVAVAVSGCGSTKTVTETTTVTRTTTVSASQPAGLRAPGERVEFGHIRSLVRKDGHTVMRFDPALLLSGETANAAAAEDGAVEPGEPVPNDNYVVDESHRAYTYLVADDVQVTLLVRSSSEKWGPTRVSLDDLIGIVGGGASGVELFEPLDTGVWITIRIDTVRAVYQQYKP
jgi:hypothetical protein